MVEAEMSYNISHVYLSNKEMFVDFDSKTFFVFVTLLYNARNDLVDRSEGVEIQTLLPTRQCRVKII